MVAAAVPPFHIRPRPRKVIRMSGHFSDYLNVQGSVVVVLAWLPACWGKFRCLQFVVDLLVPQQALNTSAKYNKLPAVYAEGSLSSLW